MTPRNSVEALETAYLDRVESALQGLPGSQRQSIIQELADHLAEARAELAPDDLAGMRTILDRMGDPDAIAREAGIARLRSPRPIDAWVPWLLLGGGFVAGIGWFVGVALLWASSTWRLGDKLLGTLVLPGGLFGLMLSLGLGVSAAAPVQNCSYCAGDGTAFPIGFAIIGLGILACVGTAIHLERVRRTV